MKVKVDKDLTVVYQGKHYGPGSVIEVSPEVGRGLFGIVEILEPEIAIAETAEPEHVILPDMKVADLRAEAERRGIEIPPKAKKADLLELLHVSEAD